MVVFTCNNCGDSLQKPKVVKHFQFHSRCNPVFLTCVDCHKDFRGDEYVKHTKCITEDERYGGKGFTLKASANKGERKQQEWINVVQNLLNSSANFSPAERNILNTLSRHENIPRKKAKFLNFIRSVFGNRANMPAIESVWTKMEESFKEATSKSQSPSENDSNTKNGKTDESSSNVSENENNKNTVKENGDSGKNNGTNSNESKQQEKKKKSKKRALETTEIQQVEEDENEAVTKKRLKTDLKESTETLATQKEEDSPKFSWKNSIIEIVSAKEEISLKKLRKKVVARYMKHSNNSSTEKATSKFDKKIKKVSEISINDDKVTLT